jgi:hypothetical protein
MFGQPTQAPAIRPALLSDMHLDFRHSYETLFLLVGLSDAMKRGVRHYRLDGTPLDRLNNVVEALIFDGEVFFDDEQRSAARAPSRATDRSGEARVGSYSPAIALSGLLEGTRAHQ